MIEEIRPDFFRLEIPLPDSPLKFLNAYLIRSPERNLIIDTGFDRKECYDAMRAGLQQLQIDMTQTDFFITHLHVDHFGLLAELMPETNILVAGDHILNDISPYIACWVDEGNPLKAYLSSLDKVNSMQIDLTLPGHRGLISDHRIRIAELKQHHSERLDELVSVLGRRNQTAYQAAARMSWDIDCASWDEFPAAQKWFATGEVIAHLHYLEEIGSIYRQIEGNIVYFAR
jgi:glyoxylase-like metal-dependent hydrolase (beta-lactamase superfamily II)